MIKLGRYNDLRVARTVDFGIYMTDVDDGTELLMPRRYVPDGTQVGDTLRCFVYRDSEGRLLATTERPVATAGEVASLRITQVGNVGAFADWGVSKELLIPHREQAVPMEVGRRYIIYIYVDPKTDRLVGTSRLNLHMDNVPPRYQTNDEVDAIVWRTTPLGYKCIIRKADAAVDADSDGAYHTAMLYRSEIFREIHVGQRVKAWVKGVREGDDKIDIALQPQGYRAAIGGIEASLLRVLHLGGGFVNLTDHSDPEEIAIKVGCSKKNFKRAVGALYKQGRISIEADGIRLVEAE